MKIVGILILSALSCCNIARAQDNWWAKHQAMVASTRAEQPPWPTPLITTTAKLDQDFRTDSVRQTNDSGYSTWNLGNSRGLELITSRLVQVTFGLPPFLDHAAPGAKDGFGDMPFTLRYRLISANREHGDYILTAVLNASVPTGKNGNGSCCAIVTPGLSAGKGWGQFALMSSANGTLPITNASGLGHSIAWNTTAEYELAKTGWLRGMWPTIESDTTFFVGGSNDGRTQSFVTPGLLVGKIPLKRRVEGKLTGLGLTLGVGEEIAVTHFHTFNHGLVLTMRVPF